MIHGGWDIAFFFIAVLLVPVTVLAAFKDQAYWFARSLLFLVAVFLVLNGAWILERNDLISNGSKWMMSSIYLFILVLGFILPPVGVQEKDSMS